MDGAELFGPWVPLSPLEVRDLFRDLTVPWWIAGGWAIELFVGRPIRPHGDVDVQVLDRDQLAVQDHLRGWDLHAADPPGSLRPWRRGEVLSQEIHNIWCRPAPDAPWALQLMLLRTDGNRWVFRRDPRISGSLSEFGTRCGEMPCVAPEVQLLYKSKLPPLPKDELDFEAALPLLDVRQRRWLINAIAMHIGEHPWLSRLRGATAG